MVTLKHQNGWQGAKKLLLSQLGVTTALALLLLYQGATAFFSVVLGGLVCSLPNTLMAVMLFKHHGASSSKKILQGFYRGEAFKLMLSALMFVLIFRCTAVKAGLFFLGYLGAQAVLWLAPVMFTNATRPDRN